MQRPLTPVKGKQNLDPNEPVYDIRGIEVKHGDLIAIGAREGNSGVLKLARVTGFGTRNEAVYGGWTQADYADGDADPNDPWGRNGGPARPNASEAVILKVEYEERGVITKGYVRAYDRRFAVLEVAGA